MPTVQHSMSLSSMSLSFKNFRPCHFRSNVTFVQEFFHVEFFHITFVQDCLRLRILSRLSNNPFMSLSSLTLRKRHLFLSLSQHVTILGNKVTKIVPHETFISIMFERVDVFPLSTVSIAARDTSATVSETRFRYNPHMSLQI